MAEIGLMSTGNGDDFSILPLFVLLLFWSEISFLGVSSDKSDRVVVAICPRIEKYRHYSSSSLTHSHDTEEVPGSSKPVFIA